MSVRRHCDAREAWWRRRLRIALLFLIWLAGCSDATDAERARPPSSRHPARPHRDAGAETDARTDRASTSDAAAPIDGASDAHTTDGASDAHATDGAFDAASTAKNTLPARAELVDALRRVDDRFIADHTDPGDARWARSVYFLGDTAAWEVIAEPSYESYALSWASSHAYTIVGTPSYADNQCAGATFLWAYGRNEEPARLASTRAALDSMVTGKNEMDWWWVDALFMAMPVFAEVSGLEGGSGYSEEMYRLYTFTKTAAGGRGLWSEHDGFWWRDATHLPPAAEPNGAPVFWGRGNGWAMGAHARVLDALPRTDPHYEEYLATFTTMARAVIASQRSDGFWGVSLLDPSHFSGPETSGTALFAFSLAWGLRTNVLPRALYEPALARALHGLLRDAVHSDGTLGWVQDVGDDPSSAQPVTATSTADFGVGVVLLALAEASKLTM
jgi:unsaturated rhamnogalacturonyl hydrolase